MSPTRWPAPACLLLAAVAWLLLPPAQVGAQVSLPELGEPADRAMSPRDEARIGRQMMVHARRTLEINADPQVAAYVDDLGQELAANADGRPLDGYTFFVVNRGEINAFAAPGGYIGIFSGLMREAQVEAQLAGVLAHEIAHVSQRHIARSVMAAEEAAPASIAQLIAGILIGAANPQAGQATIMSGLAGEAQRRLNFSRSVEEEADRIGIRILAAAGFDPAGMAQFFNILMRQEMGAINAAPEYLRTHPLSSSRIAEAQDRGEDLRREGMRTDSLEFQLMRMRVVVGGASEPAVLYERWQESGPRENPDREAARQYGLALIDLKRDRPGPAAERAARLRAADRDHLHYTLLAAEAQRALGEHDRAEALYEAATDLHPSSWPLALDHAEMLRRNGRPGDAAERLTGFLREYPDAALDLWRELARAREEAGNTVASREALAEWYTRQNRYSNAIRQLEMALEESPAESNARLRIEARLESVRNLQRGRLADDPISDGVAPRDATTTHDHAHAR